MNIINCMNIQIFDCEYHYNTQYDVVGGLVMGLSEKSGWGLKFSTLEPLISCMLAQNIIVHA